MKLFKTDESKNSKVFSRCSMNELGLLLVQKHPAVSSAGLGILSG